MEQLEVKTHPQKVVMILLVVFVIIVGCHCCRKEVAGDDRAHLMQHRFACLSQMFNKGLAHFVGFFIKLRKVEDGK